MAISAATVWEVRTTGADTNGGGFVAGAAGTDYSQQNSAQYSGTDLAVDATTNTKVTSASHSFVSADVGNLLQVTAGASWTVGFYQIVSVASGAATLDRSPAATSTTGGSYGVGGALATIGKALGGFVKSNKIFVKATATYVITANLTLPSSAGNAGPTSLIPFNRLTGYTSTRGDGGRVTLQLSTNTGLKAIDGTSSQGWIIENFNVDCNSLGTSTGISIRDYCVVRNCKVSNFATNGLANVTNPHSLFERCEVTGGLAGATAAINLTQAGQVLWSNVHDNACPGVLATGTAITVVSCLITNNTGASSYGIQASPVRATVMNNTVHGNGNNGIQINSAGVITGLIRNNILSQNGGYGLSLNTAGGTAADPMWDGNAYYLNTSGARQNADDTTVNKQNNVAPYANPLDVTLSANPYTNSAGNDFSLNNTAGGGAACRGFGTPGSFAGSSSAAGNLDMGAIQHADPASVSVPLSRVFTGF